VTGDYNGSQLSEIHDQLVGAIHELPLPEQERVLDATENRYILVLVPYAKTGQN
jgi:hypothetical protein